MSMVKLLRLRLRLPIGGVAVEHADNAVHAALDAAGKVVGLEARNDGAGNDDGRQRVGERAFEAVADLDAYFMLGGATRSSTPLFFCA